jgi:hypothetical protein
VNTDCTNLLLGISYCVQPVGSIATYPSYVTTTTSAMYTLTSITTTTDDYTTASPWIPTATPTPDLPHAAGTWSNCSVYRNYIDIPEFQHQSNLKDKQFASPFSNNCNYATQSHGITFSDFIQ